AELAGSSLPDAVTSILIIPLTTRQQTRGSLVVINACTLKSDDIDLLRMVTELSSTAIDNALLHQEALIKQALRHQLKLAGSIQQNLLPVEPPTHDNVNIAGLNSPCDESGGDYFDYFMVNDSQIGFVLGDATGHGIGAALIATTARACLRALMTDEPLNPERLPDVLANLNNLIEQDFSDEQYITLFIGIYDPYTRQLQYASAGHDPPLLVYRASTGAFEYLESTGLPVGMFANTVYQQGLVRELTSNDILLLMSDGVNEALDKNQEQFGKQRITEFVRLHCDLDPTALIQSLIDKVFEFSHGMPRNDDITMVCLKLK
ncbi:MAG: GAF domain-containing SpoIIE family protein phosphatase, partial [Pseudomonadota bacterium]